MKTIFLTEIEISDLMSEIETVVQRVVQREVTSLVGASAKKSQPVYLSTSETCARFGISRATLSRHVARGVVECLKIGRKCLYDEQKFTNSLIKLNARKGGNYEF